MTLDRTAERRRILAATGVGDVVVIRDTSVVDLGLDRISVALAGRSRTCNGWSTPKPSPSRHCF